MTDKLNNQLNKERHNKKDMLFSFEELADEGKAAKILDKLVKIFTKAGNGVIPEDSKASAAEIGKISRPNGIKTREIKINFLDSQYIVLRVKSTGDIYQVLLTGKAIPIIHQDNQVKAIDEIIQKLNANRPKYQAALAKQKVKLPEASTTSRVNQVAKLTGIKDGLVTDIAQIKGETERMRGEMTQAA